MRDIVILNYRTDHGLLSRIKAYLELCKFKIAAFSTLSAAAGFVLANDRLDATALGPLMGVLLLACGACSLNQYQERETDALMNRTETRPLPTGKISPEHALFFSLFLLLSGASLLITHGNTAIFSLGIFAFLWYNGVYTYLKKISAFAAIPGALTGAVPPAIGWIAGDGEIYSYKMATICFFFFIWQVPHFWLLLLSHDNDYSKAGFPTLKMKFSVTQIKRITFTWIAATAVSSLFLLLCMSSQNSVIQILLTGSASLLICNAFKLFDKKTCSCMNIFHVLNIFMFVILILLNLA